MMIILMPPGQMNYASRSAWSTNEAAEAEDYMLFVETGLLTSLRIKKETGVGPDLETYKAQLAEAEELVQKALSSSNILPAHESSELSCRFQALLKHLDRIQEEDFNTE